MTDWNAVGGNPAPGDVALLRSFATEFRNVGDGARTVADRLGAISRGLGAHVWTGPAAEVFAEIAVVGLQRTAGEMASRHADAAAAMTAYADAVEDAQARARRAADAAGAAASAEIDASRAHQSAAADSSSAVAARGQAQQRIAQARALEAAATDPVYIAQLKQYEQQMTYALSAALSKEDAASRRITAAAASLQQAQESLGRARADAQAARSTHDDAVRVVVSRLRDDQSYVDSVFTLIGRVVTDLDTWVKTPLEVVGALLRGRIRNIRYTRLDRLLFAVFKKFGGRRFENILHYKRPGQIPSWLNKPTFVPKITGNPVFRVVSKYGGPVLGAFSVYEDYQSFREHQQAHDRLGEVTDVMDAGGDLLLSNPESGPYGLLIGVNLKIWSGVIKAGRKIDWSDIGHRLEPAFQPVAPLGGLAPRLTTMGAK